MKLYILLLFLMVSNISWTQFKSLFGEDTTQWNVIYSIPDYFPTYMYKAHTDTIIGNDTYLKVFEAEPNSTFDLIGYLKEDTSSGKLWYRSLNEKERLLMDLSLEKSDTFYFGFDDSLFYTVDTTFYSFGRKYVSFNGDSNDSILFIEELGLLIFFILGMFFYRTERKLGV